MATLIVREKINGCGEPIKYGSILVVNTDKLIGVRTKTMYIRKGLKNGTLFLSTTGFGTSGMRDICCIEVDDQIDVNKFLFNRILKYAEKAGAIVSFNS